MTWSTADERLLVALACVGDLHDVLPDPADQIAVIDDVVRTWQALPPASRSEYTARDNGRFNAVMHYAWAYVAQVDEAAVASLVPGTRADDIDRACVLYWRQHVSRLHEHRRFEWAHRSRPSR